MIKFKLNVLWETSHLCVCIIRKVALYCCNQMTKHSKLCKDPQHSFAIKRDLIYQYVTACTDDWTLSFFSMTHTLAKYSYCKIVNRSLFRTASSNIHVYTSSSANIWEERTNNDCPSV